MTMLPSDKPPQDMRDVTTLFQQELLPALRSYMTLCRMKGRGDKAMQAIEGQELMKIAVCVAIRQVWEGYREMGGTVGYAAFTKEFLGNIQNSIEQHERNETLVAELLSGKSANDKPA